MPTGTKYFPVLNPNQPPQPVSSNIGNIVNQAIPGFSGLNQQATGIIGNLMGGMPSAAPTQRANAYFGTSSGMPGSDFVRNRGFDLYGEEAEKHKQRGFDDFLQLLSGYSGTVMPTAGQDLQTQQFNTELDFRNRQAAAQNELDNKAMSLKRRPAFENSYTEYSPLGTVMRSRRSSPTRF